MDGYNNSVLQTYDLQNWMKSLLFPLLGNVYLPNREQGEAMKNEISHNGLIAQS